MGERELPIHSIDAGRAIFSSVDRTLETSVRMKERDEAGSFFLTPG